MNKEDNSNNKVMIIQCTICNCVIAARIEDGLYSDTEWLKGLTKYSKQSWINIETVGIDDFEFLRPVLTCCRTGKSDEAKDNRILKKYNKAKELYQTNKDDDSPF